LFESQLCMFGRHETSNRFKKYGQLANLLNHFRAYYQKSKLAHKQYPKTWPRLNKTIFTKVFFSCIICRCCYWSHSCVHCTLLRVVKFDGLKRFFFFHDFFQLTVFLCWNKTWDFEIHIERIYFLNIYSKNWGKIFLKKSMDAKHFFLLHIKSNTKKKSSDSKWQVLFSWPCI